MKKHVYTLKKLLPAIAFIGATAFCTRANAQGAGNALYFLGTTAFEHVNLGDSLSDRLGKESFTIEMWVNFDNVANGDPAFIGNKDWNSGTNTGFAWALYSTNTLRFNFRAASGTRRDYNTTITKLLSNWNHLAMVVDRKGSLTAYVNGIQTGTAINIAVDSARTIDGTLPIRIGSDGTGTYNYSGTSRFNGKLEEVRFWLGTRSVQDLRANMCHKLTGTEAGLLAYYPMNESTGDTLHNTALAYNTVFNGVLQNTPQRLTSAAPVGDTSVYNYPVSWSGQTIALGNVTGSTVTVQNVTGNTAAIQVYRVNNTPGNITGITGGADKSYFGVYPVETTTNAGTYNYIYSYAANTQALAQEESLACNRRATTDSTWTVAAATKNTTSHTFSGTGAQGRSELLLTAAVPLPLSLIRFIVERKSAGNIISWQTAAENKLNGFRLTRSTDGQHFSPISFIKADGKPAQYSYTDQPSGAGTVYYQLETEEADGANSYSKIIAVQSNDILLTAVQAYPNPFSDKLSINISASDAAPIKLRLTNMIGNVVLQQNINSGLSGIGNELLSTLPAGIYLLSIEANGITKTLKLLKK